MELRSTRLATISLPHHKAPSDQRLRPKSQEELLQLAESFIRQAGEQGADFVSLPELFGSFGIDEQYAMPRSLAEPIPGHGKAFSFLADQARRYKTHITATILEEDGGRYFNCGVLIGRCGELIGKYRKVHPAPDEREWISAGDEFPVFETEMVRCGIQICFDLNFPEGARCLALQGVDIIFWPTMWGSVGSEAYDDAVMRTRAGENMCFLVSSALVNTPAIDRPGMEVKGRSCIVSWKSDVVAEVGQRVGVAMATVDLTEERYTQGRREDMLGTYRRPDCYLPIAREGDCDVPSPVSDL